MDPWRFHAPRLGASPAVPCTALRAEPFHSKGRTLVLLSRFAKRWNGLVKVQKPVPLLPFVGGGDGGRKAESKMELLKRALRVAGICGLVVGAASGLTTMAVCVPVIGQVAARVTTGALNGYAKQRLDRRSKLRDQATAGAFLMELPSISETKGGRLMLQGMLLEGPEGSQEAEHLAMLRFPSHQMVESFLEDPDLLELKNQVLEDLEAIELTPKHPWRAYLEAVTLRRGPLRRFCKASAAFVAQKLARLGGAVAVVHFVSAGGSVDAARRAAANTLRDVWRAGGRGKYFATSPLLPDEGCGHGELEVIVSFWKRPGQLMKYMRNAPSTDWQDDEEDFVEGAVGAVEQLLVCPTL